MRLHLVILQEMALPSRCIMMELRGPSGYMPLLEGRACLNRAECGLHALENGPLGLPGHSAAVAVCK